MKRSELEHLIRAAGRIADQREIVVIGSQAILGQFPEAPDALRHSMEGDVYPKDRPELADKVDGAIGEGSAFHRQFGYYAQGVAPDTAILPRGWQKRLVRVENENTDGFAGLCLEVHDLAISKYVAGREKDLEFTRVLARHSMTGKKMLLSRLAVTRLESALSASCAHASIGISQINNRSELSDPATSVSAQPRYRRATTDCVFSSMLTPPRPLARDQRSGSSRRMGASELSIAR